MFSNNLRTALSNKGATQKELAEFVNVKPNTVSDWLKQGNSPKLEHLCRIRDFFDVPLDWLIAGKEENALSGAAIAALHKSEALNHLLSVDERLLLENYRIIPKEKRYELQRKLDRIAAIIKAGEADRIKEEASLYEEIAKEQTEMPVYTQSAAAGLGNSLYDEVPFDTLSFDEDTVPVRADFGIRISGDSMEPKIKDGSIVWVEERIQLDSGEIGIFILDGKAFCKKLHIDHEERRTSLVSLNKDYEDIVLMEHNEFKTIGKVLL